MKKLSPFSMLLIPAGICLMVLISTGFRSDKNNQATVQQMAYTYNRPSEVVDAANRWASKGWKVSSMVYDSNYGQYVVIFQK